MLRKSVILFLIPALLFPSIFLFAQKPFPYTAEENADGARFVWFVLSENMGYERPYEKCADIPQSKYYTLVDTPQTGDVIWWKEFMAFYDADAPGDKKVVAMGGTRSLGELTKKYGKPRFYRVVYTPRKFEVQK